MGVCVEMGTSVLVAAVVGTEVSLNEGTIEGVGSPLVEVGPA